MCKIFNHRVIAVQWVPKDKHASLLGFVEHRYNSRILYQRIGVFFTVNWIAIFIGFNTSTFIAMLATYNAYLIGWMSFVLCMSVMTLVLTFTISLLKRQKFLRISA